MASPLEPSTFVEFVERMGPALRQAAAITHALEGRVRNRPKTGEETAVKQALTVADTASQEALLVPLLEYFPWVRLEAEEDTPSVDRFAREGDACVVIDPVDGTLHSYLGHQGPYAIMVGLVVRGVYEAGLVALPREGLFFDATRGGGARSARAGGSGRDAHLAADGGKVLVSHGMPEPVSQRLAAMGFEVVHACGGAVSVAPLIKGVRAGLRFAAGDHGISVRGRIGALIAREAGAVVQRGNGQPFPADDSTAAQSLVVAVSDEDARKLRDALCALDGVR